MFFSSVVVCRWQGIVPCKTEKMSEVMVEMVTTQLLSVEKTFKRLDPRRVADLLAPEVPKLTKKIGGDLFPKWLLNLPEMVVFGLPLKNLEMLNFFNRRFIMDFTVDMQNNIDKCIDLRNCVVEQMLLDRSLLGKLFQKVGSEELSFLTNSGLWFGFMLGIIQMIIALFYDNPWSLSIGGTIVGLATNWLALKWIFEPVHPTKIGPWIVQGKFLRRQDAVSKEFSTFFATKILTSEKLWHSILTNPGTSPFFNALFSKHLAKFIGTVTGGLAIKPEPEVINLACERAIKKLPEHIGVLHEYVDETLGLQETLCTQMKAMSAEKFERVLHPIFEEDELTLIVAGGILGFLAGLVQQGLETGAIVLPSVKTVLAYFKTMPGRIRHLPGRIGAGFTALVALAKQRGMRGSSNDSEEGLHKLDDKNPDDIIDADESISRTDPTPEPI